MKRAIVSLLTFILILTALCAQLSAATAEEGYLALERGAQGEAVSTLQQSLIDLGYLAQDEADGVYGIKTFEAVCAFELVNDLTSDGAADAQMLALLYSPDALAAPDPLDQVVYIAPYSGRRYHSSPDCSGLRNARSVEGMFLTGAEEYLTPCKICY